MSDIIIERSADIAAPPSEVLPWIVDFHRWVDWSPWEGLDPQLARTYSGSESGVGSVYEWSGNRKAGAGRMEIKSVTANQVTVDLAFRKPFKSRNEVYFVLTPTATGTHAVWRMRFPKTVTTRLFGLLTSMDKAVGGDLEKGLAGLSRVAAG